MEREIRLKLFEKLNLEDKITYQFRNLFIENENNFGGVFSFLILIGSTIFLLSNLLLDDIVYCIYGIVLLLLAIVSFIIVIRTHKKEQNELDSFLIERSKK